MCVSFRLCREVSKLLSIGSDFRKREDIVLSYKGYQEIMGQEEENWSKEEERREKKE